MVLWGEVVDERTVRKELRAGFCHSWIDEGCVLAGYFHIALAAGAFRVLQVLGVLKVLCVIGVALAFSTSTSTSAVDY